MMKTRYLAAGLLFLGLVVLSQSPTMAQRDKPYPVEYYYKVKWGHFDEFLELYKRNHYPILVNLQQLGRIVDMSAAAPRYHSGEGTRWDFRYTIVWKNASVANDDFDTSEIIRRLYPDQEKFRKEEQRRFELLEQHLDVPIDEFDLQDWPKGN